MKGKVKARSWDTIPRSMRGKSLHQDPLMVNYSLSMEIGIDKRKNETNEKLIIIGQQGHETKMQKEIKENEVITLQLVGKMMIQENEKNSKRICMQRKMKKKKN